MMVMKELASTKWAYWAMDKSNDDDDEGTY